MHLELCLVYGQHSVNAGYFIITYEKLTPICSWTITNMSRSRKSCSFSHYPTKPPAHYFCFNLASSNEILKYEHSWVTIFFNILVIPFKTMNLETSTKNSFHISNTILTSAKQKLKSAQCPMFFLKKKNSRKVNDKSFRH